MDFPGGSVVENLPTMQETQQEMWVQSLGLKELLEEGMTTHLLPGESSGQRSLVGYSP